MAHLTKKVNKCDHPHCIKPFGMARHWLLNKQFCSTVCRDSYRAEHFSPFVNIVFAFTRRMLKKQWRMSQKPSPQEMPQRQMSLHGR